MSADGGSVKNTLGSESSCSSASSADTVKRRREYGKKDRKLVRILTVVAYVISVSMAAVLLSTYYVFLWNPDPKTTTESPKQSHFTQSLPTTSRFSQNNNPHYNKFIQSSFALPASQVNMPNSYKYNNKPFGLHYASSHTKSYQQQQIPTPQPLLMMTKILTTMRTGAAPTSITPIPTKSMDEITVA